MVSLNLTSFVEVTNFHAFRELSHDVRLHLLSLNGGSKHSGHLSKFSSSAEHVVQCDCSSRICPASIFDIAFVFDETDFDKAQTAVLLAGASNIFGLRWKSCKHSMVFCPVHGEVLFEKVCRCLLTMWLC